MKKVTWHLSQVNNVKFPIQLEAESNGKKQLSTRWDNIKHETLMNALGFALTQAMASKYDYGNKSRLVITGQLLTNCSVDVVEFDL